MLQRLDISGVLSKIYYRMLCRPELVSGSVSQVQQDAEINSG